MDAAPAVAKANSRYCRDHSAAPRCPFRKSVASSLAPWGVGHQDDKQRNQPTEPARRTAMPRPFGSAVQLPDELRGQLEALVRAGSTPQALALRCRIVLCAAAPDNPSNQDIAGNLGCNRHTVGRW